MFTVVLTLVEPSPAGDPGGAVQVVVFPLGQADRHDVRRERHRLVEPETEDYISDNRAKRHSVTSFDYLSYFQIS